MVCWFAGVVGVAGVAGVGVGVVVAVVAPQPALRQPATWPIG